MQTIAIIGAGVAGLTAAYQLNDTFDVHLYEARERVGGRVHSIVVDGHIGELGAHNILDGGSAPSIHKLAQELDLTIESYQVPFDYHLIEGGQDYPLSHHFASYSKRHPDLESHLQSMANGARHMGDIIDAIGEEDPIVSKGAAAILASYEGSLPNRLSLSNIGTLAHILLGGISSVHQEHEIEFESIVGGNSLLPEALAKKLAPSVHLNCPLKKLERIDGIYELTFENGQTTRADLVILTLPASTYHQVEIDRALVSPELLELISSIEYGQNSKILLPQRGSTPRFQSCTDGEAIAYHSIKAPVSYLYLNHKGYSSLEEAYQHHRDIISQVAPLEGNVAQASQAPLAQYEQPVGHHWPEDRYAQGSYSCFGIDRAELLTEIVSYEGAESLKLFAPIDHSLFFAGEHTTIDPEIRGTMEAAAESGMRVAKQIKGRYGRG